ncbi:cupin domain-containing protein [Jatrophihabitans sp.]|uniref:cupin domain-containing protein n=1 Tax=Jatrophihabitans sp. TaxID=1932789 RepID=UPI002D0CE0CB|nr:cupin domain-containing protein [Jatrophihabitans sp.]
MGGADPVGAALPSSDAVAASALARCIGMPVERFAAEYWSRQPLLTPAAESGADYTDLLDTAAIDELLSRRGLRTPFLRLAKQGKVIPAREFTRSGGLGAGVADQVADDKVLGLIADGATLVLQGLHRNWPPLVRFGSRLAAELGHPVQINSYLTPPQNQGFAPHYDTHDVFVLQVAGRKRWVVHRPVFADPLPGQDWEQHRAAVTARAAEPPLLDLLLQPGDALYLPRGYLHSAVAQGDTSIHLTVGVHPVTRYALLKHLLAEAAGEPELRASLPLGGDLAEEARLAGQVHETVRAFTAFAESGRVPQVAGRLADELAGSTRPEPIEPMAQLAALAGLTPAARFRLRPGLRPRLERRPDAVRVLAVDTGVSLPAAAEPALKLVLSGEPVSAETLPGLDAAAALDLVRRLLTAAVLVPDA